MKTSNSILHFVSGKTKEKKRKGGGGSKSFKFDILNTNITCPCNVGLIKKIMCKLNNFLYIHFKWGRGFQTLVTGRKHHWIN